MKFKIQTKAALTIVMVLAVAMCVFLGIVYFFSSGRVIEFIDELAVSSADRVALNIARPLKNGDSDLIKDILGAETVDKRMYAIIVREAGASNIFTAILKEEDKPWREIADESAITEKYVKKSQSVELNGKRLGTVAVYCSTRYTKFQMGRILIAIIAAGFFLTVLILTGLLFSIRRVVIRPLNAVNEVMENISKGEGDLTVRIQVHGEDEIAELARHFNVFVEKIQVLVSQVKEGAETLATSTSQISATASELSASSVEASSTLSQVTSTAEEIKQTSIVSSEKAELVAKNAETATVISDEGRKATDEAEEGMRRIKEEMEYIAESIVKLSEHSQSIGEIIGAVNDLANESNLLSVNASIEASKAGEFGKGFGVVAQEVKSLSGQSKQATSQVKGILNDIQSSTSAAVMAMERGVKAVETGSALASRSGEAIQNLSGSVEDSSKSAAQISASSQQQLLGLDQLTNAMESIKVASSQNADGAQQLEQATAQLHELGLGLKDLAGKFKVE